MIREQEVSRYFAVMHSVKIFQILNLRESNNEQ